MVAQFIDKGNGNYEVVTDSSPQFINEIAIHLFNVWKDFASGRRELGGRRLEHPTGQYAASITMVGNGQTSISITANSESALPLELGHGPIDLKQKLEWGRRYPMHRFARVFTGFSPPVPMSKNTPAWVIPAMRPYAPAEILAKLAAKEL